VFRAVARAKESSLIAITPALAGLAAPIVRTLRNAAHARV